jgi:universal stress protein A
LVPVDFSRGSAKSLCYASAIAKVRGAKIILLHITKPISFSADFGYGTVQRQVTDAAQMRKDRSRLRRSAANHLSPGAIEDIIIRSGNAPEHIIWAAKDVRADLIVLYAHEANDSRSVGSHKTAEQVMRSAQCPVLVVRSHEHDFIQPVRKRRQVLPRICHERVYSLKTHRARFRSREGH